jgi:hypothetical protein
MRSTAEIFEAKSNWLNDVPSRQAIFDRHGTKHTIFDTLPNWYSPSRAPIDGMHLFFLNIMPHLWRDVLLATGMFQGLEDDSGLTSGERIDACFDSGILPHHIGRMPPKVSTNLSGYTI